MNTQLLTSSDLEWLIATEGGSFESLSAVATNAMPGAKRMVASLRF